MDDNLRKVKIARGIADLRKEQGLSQADLGKLMARGRQHIHDIEQGNTNIGVLLLCEIAEALGVTLSEFFKRIDM